MEVKVTKCQNGHYFDLNKHEICPHCGAPEFTVNITQPKKTGFAFFKKKEKKNEVASKYNISQNSLPKVDPVIDADELDNDNPSPQIVIEEVETENKFILENDSNESEDAKTEGFFSTDNIANHNVTSGVAQINISNNNNNNNNQSMFDDQKTAGYFSSNNDMDVAVIENQSKEDYSLTDDEITTGFFSEKSTYNEQSTSHNYSLLEEIKRITADSEFKIVGMSGQKNNKDINQENKGPVVGWLVCIGGKYSGKDFKIITGKNSIGRNVSNDIWLENEESVSSEKHAWVIYEPRKREFFIQPGESNGLIYLNGDTVFDVQKLEKNDMLEFGNSKFLFIPLCSATFSWEDYLDKE